MAVVRVIPSEGHPVSAKMRIPRAAIPDLITIRGIGVKGLESVCNALEKCQKLPLRRSDLLATVEAALEGKTEQSDSLVSQSLIFLQLIRTHDYESEEELLHALREAINVTDSPWTDEEIQDWKAIEPTLARLLRVDAFRSVAKAADLEYEFSNLFMSARVITDIRPVFNDEEGDLLKIDGAVVSHTLRLLYDNLEGQHVLSLALDLTDIESLKAQCDRALSKAQLAKNLVESKIPVVISGDR